MSLKLQITCITVLFQKEKKIQEILNVKTFSCIFDISGFPRGIIELRTIWNEFLE